MEQTEIEADVTVWHVAHALAHLDPTGVDRAAWLAPRLRPTLSQLSRLLVTLGVRLVARGLPPYQPATG